MTSAVDYTGLDRPRCRTMAVDRLQNIGNINQRRSSRGVICVRRQTAEILAYLKGGLRALTGISGARLKFERLYLSYRDPWKCLSSHYEHDKYAETIGTIKALSAGRNAALEIGCGIGVFTEVLASTFTHVVAIDVSSIGLARARRRISNQRVTFARTDLRHLALSHRFDAIVCAEVLYYLPETDAKRVCAVLKAHLTETGLIFMISGAPREMDNGKNC